MIKYHNDFNDYLNGSFQNNKNIYKYNTKLNKV